MTRAGRAWRLWASLWLLAAGCTDLEPTRVNAKDAGGDAGHVQSESDSGVAVGGTGVRGGGRGGSLAGGGRDGGGGGSGAQAAFDGGHPRADGGVDGGAGRDAPWLPEGDSGTPRCIGDGEMIDIPAGTFLRGDATIGVASPAQLKDVDAFSIDRTEVTVIAYQDCVDDEACELPADPSGFCNVGPAGRACHPMNCVSWEQAVAYCAWADKRLPTELEWEFAARGQEARRFPWGDDGNPDTDETLAQFNETMGTAEVGTHHDGATPEGAEDMAGNVWEWTSDLFCDSYRSDAMCSDEVHTDRGGSWASMQALFILPAFREGDTVTGGDDRFGFRCAR